MKAKQSLRRRWTKRASSFLMKAIGPTVIRLLSWSWKTRFIGRSEIEEMHAGNIGPVVSFWHQQIPAGIGTHIGYPARVLVSKHRDGEMIASISQRLKFKTVRGSSSSGGSRVVREMLEGDFGEDALCFTPDGPRGPCFSVAPGLAFIAAKSRRPVVLTGFASSKYWQANSWDKMVIPKPFARVVVTYSNHLGVPGEEVGEEGEEQEQFLRDIRTGMDQCELEAKQELQRGLEE